MSTAVLFIIAPKWTRPNGHQQVDEKQIAIYPYNDYYSAMNHLLRTIMLRERNHMQRTYSDRKQASGCLELRLKGAWPQMGMRESSGMMEIFFLYLNVVEVTQAYTFIRTHQSVVLYCIKLYLNGRERESV